MTYYEAINILDERREGADMPQERINIALFLTGDISENEILRVYPYGNTANPDTKYTNAEINH